MNITTKTGTKITIANANYSDGYVLTAIDTKQFKTVHLLKSKTAIDDLLQNEYGFLTRTV